MIAYNTKKIKNIAKVFLIFLAIFMMYIFWVNNYKFSSQKYEKIENLTVEINEKEDKNNYINNPWWILWTENINYWVWLIYKSENNSCHIITAKHIANDVSKEYVITDNKWEEFIWKVTKLESNKDISEIKIDNCDKKIKIVKSKPKNWEKIFRLNKNWEKKYWKILWINESIQINSKIKKDLIKINIKSSKWDSWSPIFNSIWELIWINIIWDTQTENSYIEIIN